MKNCIIHEMLQGTTLGGAICNLLAREFNRLVQSRAASKVNEGGWSVHLDDDGKFFFHQHTDLGGRQFEVDLSSKIDEFIIAVPETITSFTINDIKALIKPDEVVKHNGTGKDVLVSMRKQPD